jgi:biopolymer transport protein ExbD
MRVSDQSELPNDSASNAMPLKIQHDEMPNLNLTSLIDVVFLLIVFFMTASRFTDPARDIDLELPEVAQGDSLSVAQKAREVAVHADGRLSLDGRSVTLEELTEQLAPAIDAAPQQSVVILGDAGCAFQHVAAAMAACKEAGVTDLAVSVQLAEAPPAGTRR